MFGGSESTVTPRNGHTLVVGVVARISGCPNQKEISLDDQVDHAKEIVGELYQGTVEYRVIATKGKGERLDRPELREVEAMIRSRELDLLVVEDIGRVVRGTEAARLCGIAKDQGTRVLAPNDCIDTDEENWETDVIEACADHVSHNNHTSKRIKFKKMNRFIKFGGATPVEIYGYIVPDDAKTYDDWQKDPAATPIIREGARRLRETRNCSAVADWFNSQSVPVGPYCRRVKWDGRMVRRFFKNSLLKGMPGRGFVHTVKHNETGRRVSVNNPKGPRFRECPHLAHLNADEFDSLNATLEAANALFKRRHVKGEDPLLRRPRKRTVFPGQHARCSYCGRQYVWGGNGIAENLMCTGTREWLCWNSIGFNGEVARRGVIEAITTRLHQLGGFEAQFAEMIKAAGENASGGLSDRWNKLRRAEEQHRKEQDNLKATLKALGPYPMVQETLAELDARGKELIRERRYLETTQARPLEIPGTISDLHGMIVGEFEQQAAESPEFGELLRKLVPGFEVFLVRLCDGSHFLPRASVRLDLLGSFEDVDRVPGLRSLLYQELTIDLFTPPQREKIRVEAVKLAAQGLSHRQIGRQLPGNPTSTAVGNALALQRMMEKQGLTTPYVVVGTPPDDTRLRRHKNSKYQFTPLDGFNPQAS